MRLRLEKITKLDQIQVNDTLLRDGSYPAVVECIDGRDGLMWVHIKCILNGSEYKYDFDFVNMSIKNNKLFKVLE